MDYRWDFIAVLRDPEWLALGLLGTVKLTAASLAGALPLGLVVAVLRMSRYRLVSAPVVLYVDFLRTSPTLVLFFWAFFALPLLIGVKLTPFAVGVVALTLQYSAFFGEIFRGGIRSIEKGQWDAARAIGMSYPLIMRWVVLPPAIRRMIPAFLSHAVDLMKATSLAATISYGELMYEAGRVSAETYRPIETLTLAAAAYFALLFTASRLVAVLERRLAVSDARLKAA
jgi:polar amino acid transport system permease protein